MAECEEQYGFEAVEEILDSGHALMDQGVFRYRRRPKLSLRQQKEIARERQEHEDRTFNDLWRTVPVDNDHEEQDEEAKALAQSGAEAGTVVWAREQTAGKGRHGRSWTSPRGNLYLSIIQRPNCRLADAPQMGFVTGVALADALQWLVNVPIALKWPNDLMIEGKKASGILLESAADAKGRLDWLVIGVGVNVESFPSGLPDVTSLRETGATISIEGLLSVFLERLFWHADEWQHTGFEATRRRWLRR